MRKNNSYRYPTTKRETIDGLRHYNINDKEKLPSVTTILDATQSAEKRESLQRWKERVGEEQAEKIKDQAAERGTAMHKILEKYIIDVGYVDLTNVGKAAHNMAIQIIQSGLINVTEFYGTECTLHYPGLYAGQTDLVGIHKGKDAIIDFKQTNKPKKREWISDYFSQLSAYAMAHNFIYKTKITKGVIMMCSKDNFYQEFVVEGLEFQKYKHNFLRRVDEYYKTRPKKTG
jgi:ATP-dependent exoDNAse (exonuclease V) beta subunit